nr:hypothetical protein [Tanacetum cinerariifolium]
MASSCRRRGQQQIEKRRRIQQPPNQGHENNRRHNQAMVQEEILVVYIPGGYLGYPDGKLVACFVCQPVAFLRERYMITPHKKAFSGEGQ